MRLLRVFPPTKDLGISSTELRSMDIRLREGSEDQWEVSRREKKTRHKDITIGIR